MKLPHSPDTRKDAAWLSTRCLHSSTRQLCGQHAGQFLTQCSAGGFRPEDAESLEKAIALHLPAWTRAPSLISSTRCHVGIPAESRCHGAVLAATQQQHAWQSNGVPYLLQPSRSVDHAEGIVDSCSLLSPVGDDAPPSSPAPMRFQRRQVGKLTVSVGAGCGSPSSVHAPSSRFRRVTRH